MLKNQKIKNKQPTKPCFESSYTVTN